MTSISGKTQRPDLQTIESQQNPHQPGFLRGHLGKIAVGLAFAASVNPIVQAFSGDKPAIHPGGDTDTGELSDSGDGYITVVEEALTDMGLEHVEDIKDQYEQGREVLSPEDKLKQSTFVLWRKQKSSNEAYMPYCLANYIRVTDENGDSQNVFSTASHCVDRDVNGNPTGLLDILDSTDAAISPVDVAESSQWDVVFTKPGGNPTQPVAEAGAMIANAGSMKADLLLVKPKNASPVLDEVEPTEVGSEAPKPGSQALVVRVDSNQQLNIYHGVYLGQGTDDKGYGEERVWVKDANAGVSFAGSSGAAVYILDENGKFTNALLAEGTVANKAAVDDDEYTEEQLAADLAWTRSQTPVKLPPGNDLTILNFSGGSSKLAKKLL